MHSILSNRTSEDTAAILDRNTSHIFSLFWMLIRKRLPHEISDDIVSWLSTTSVPQINRDVLLGLAEESDFGEIEMDIGGNLFKFSDAELAPPTGAMAANYSR